MIQKYEDLFVLLLVVVTTATILFFVGFAHGERLGAHKLCARQFKGELRDNKCVKVLVSPVEIQP